MKLVEKEIYHKCATSHTIKGISNRGGFNMPLYEVRVREDIVRTYRITAKDKEQALNILTLRLSPEFIYEDMGMCKVLDAKLIKSIPITKLLCDKGFARSLGAKSTEYLIRLIKVNDKKIDYKYEIDFNQPTKITLGDVVLYSHGGS